MNRKFDFFKKIELVISHPHRFFEKVKKEKNIWGVFEFYFIFVFLSMVINTLFSLPELTKSNMDIGAAKYLLFIIILIAFVLLIALLASFASFVLYFIYHILIKIFKGREKYKETYKLLYAATPLLIVLLIPYQSMFKILFYPFFIIAALDTLYIEYIGLQKLQRMSKENAVAVIILTLLIGIFSIMFLVKKGVIGLL